MSNPRYPWWSTAVRMVRNYPCWKRQHDELHSQSCVAELSGMPHSGNASRTTENIALQQLPRAIQNEYDAVSRAIEITNLMPDGEKRVELIRQMYWKGKKLNVTDVLPLIGVADATGWRWHSAFIQLVGECAGYL